MSTRTGICLAAYTAAILLASPDLASPQSPRQDTMRPEHVLSGASMTEAQCAALDSSVWVVKSGQGDCIRYFGGGLENKSDRGDRLFSRRPAVAQLEPRLHRHEGAQGGLL